MAEAMPGAVAFLDFGDPDFDQVTAIEPSRPTRKFWQKQLAVALGSVDIHAMARKAAERWMKAQKLVSVLS
jgi:hypothetical protein